MRSAASCSSRAPPPLVPEPGLRAAMEPAGPVPPPAAPSAPPPARGAPRHPPGRRACSPRSQAAPFRCGRASSECSRVCEPIVQQQRMRSNLSTPRRSTSSVSQTRVSLGQRGYDVGRAAAPPWRPQSTWRACAQPSVDIRRAYCQPLLRLAAPARRHHRCRVAPGTVGRTAVRTRVRVRVGLSYLVGLPRSEACRRTRSSLAPSPSGSPPSSHLPPRHQRRPLRWTRASASDDLEAAAAAPSVMARASKSLMDRAIAARSSNSRDVETDPPARRALRAACGVVSDESRASPQHSLG